ncbi:Apl3p, partial [Ascoidea rubescens DSM 1968]
GLTQFISDLRNAKAFDDQDRRINSELVNIQKQFAAGHLTGYQRKKYVCKLLYIYLMGHKINFGYMESIQLLPSKIYSEKEIGYMAISLFLNKHNELLSLIVNSIKNDLSISNNDFNCLALQCIATLGEENWSDLLSDDVFQLLRSPTNPSLVRKKAALALLKLLKAQPNILIDRQGWIPRIVACIDDQDIGFVTSIASLVSFIASKFPDSVRMCVPAVARRLSKLVIENQCAVAYRYYDIPNPWLVVKLLDLVKNLISDGSVSDIDAVSIKTLKNVVAKAIEKGTMTYNTQQSMNAQSAILFSAVSLAAHLDPSPDALSSAIDALGSLVSSAETNTRYLALDSLTKITVVGGFPAQSSIKRHSELVLKSLKDKDISVRRKALELLYAICDTDNVEKVVGELLKFLSTADYALRSEISVKIAVLAEKFSTDPHWYVNTCLKLISIAGSQVPEEVWERITQIIINNETLQSISCKSIIRFIKQANCPDALIKIGAYVLGEYGHLILNSPTYSPREQFAVLSNKYYYVNLITRSMLLTAFFKMFKNYQSLDRVLKFDILKIFKNELVSIDSEIQQRAFEYLKIIEIGNKDGGNFHLLNVLCEEAPPFPERVSPLLSRLGGNFEIFEKNKKAIRNMTGTSTGSSNSAPPPTSELIQQSTSNSYGSSIGHSNNGSSVQLNPFNEEEDESSDEEINDRNNISNIILTPNWEEGYYRIINFGQGVFFENSLFKILYRTIKDSNEPTSNRISLTYVNKSPIQISALTSEIKLVKTTDPSFIIHALEIPESEVQVNSKTLFEFKVTIRKPIEISESPLLLINFISGGFTQLKLKVPITIINFLKATEIPKEQFFNRWNQIGVLGKEGEDERVFKAKKTYNRIGLRRILNRLGFQEIQGIENTNDNSTSKFVGSSILYSKLKGNFGCLIRLESENISAYDTGYDIDGSKFKITIRVTSPGIAKTIGEVLQKLLEFGA